MKEEEIYDDEINMHCLINYVVVKNKKRELYCT